ncbi:hypothetical protein K5E_21550 [Enterococcus thailandicus]|uniref:hypothetical protein n=1 Tax=Enterococcus thailandicus TaxID=417368 RepID=UPI00244D8A26|nr:hypothetical protein [Enterococcus thailandicus]GMC03137.1 hypothetical protein K4E_06550 [Enterococcus thailandicus]GMC10016.1 hypothetical protein K5E_21550 [Enterococcus thailandicus]
MKKILSIGLICTSLLAASNFTTMNVQASETTELSRTDILNSRSVSDIYDQKIASVQAANDNWRVLSWTIENPSLHPNIRMGYNYGGEWQKWSFFHIEESDSYELMCGPLSEGGVTQAGFLTGHADGSVSDNRYMEDEHGIDHSRWKFEKVGTEPNGNEVIMKNMGTGQYLMYSDLNDGTGDFGLSTANLTYDELDELEGKGVVKFVIHVEGEF